MLTRMTQGETDYFDQKDAKYGHAAQRFQPRDLFLCGTCGGSQPGQVPPAVFTGNGARTDLGRSRETTGTVWLRPAMATTLRSIADAGGAINLVLFQAVNQPKRFGGIRGSIIGISHFTPLIYTAM